MIRTAAQHAAVLAICLTGCGGDEPEPRTPAPEAERSIARRDTHEAMLTARAQVRHASDGGGTAWLDTSEGDGAISAGGTGSWTIHYEAGPLGIAEGGAVYLQVSPFWGWSTPQTEAEGAPGYTVVTTNAAGVELEPRTLDRQLLGVTVRDRALAEGERVTFVYGAGAVGARADSYAEAASTFWIAVDGDGDGVRKVLRDSPSVEVLPGPPAGLVLSWPTIARPGETVRLTAALLDGRANGQLPVSASIELLDRPAGLELPTNIEFLPEDAGHKSVEVVARDAGVYRIRALARVGGRELEATTNPLVVTQTGPRILWGDLHGHSAVSDGTGSPEDYFLYARDVAGLDVVALTDHDHWGMLFLDEDREQWERNCEVAESFYEPGRFVTACGFEWTSWLYGHRHVLYFAASGPLLSSLDEGSSTPPELWSALLGLDAISIPHHPAGGPIAIDWSFDPDPTIEPIAEIVSAHGCSEAYDCPRLIYSPVRGHFVREALEMGHRYAFVGSGDGHDGHPGLTDLGPHYPTGGLAAILAEEPTRASVLEALRNRRTYATSGARILLRFALGGAPMGGSIPAPDQGQETDLFVQAVGTGPLRTVEILRSGSPALTLDGAGQSEVAATAGLTDLAAGEFVYARVIQEDGSMAWSSPVWID